MKLPKTIMDAVRGSVGVAMIVAAGCGGSAPSVEDPIEEPVAVAAQKPAEPMQPIEVVEQVTVDASEHHEVSSSYEYDLENVPPPCGRG